MADTDKWGQEEDEEGADLALWMCPTCEVFTGGKTNARGLLEFNCPNCAEGAIEFPESVRRHIVVEPPFREWTVCGNPFCRSAVHVLMAKCPRCRFKQGGPFKLS